MNTCGYMLASCLLLLTAPSRSPPHTGLVVQPARPAHTGCHWLPLGHPYMQLSAAAAPRNKACTYPRNHSTQVTYTHQGCVDCASSTGRCTELMLRCLARAPAAGQPGPGMHQPLRCHNNTDQCSRLHLRTCACQPSSALSP